MTSVKSAYKAFILMGGAGRPLDRIHASAAGCYAKNASRHEEINAAELRCLAVCICYLYRQAVWAAIRRGRLRRAAKLMRAGIKRHFRDRRQKSDEKTD